MAFDRENGEVDKRGGDRLSSILYLYCIYVYKRSHAERRVLELMSILFPHLGHQSQKQGYTLSPAHLPHYRVPPRRRNSKPHVQPRAFFQPSPAH